MTIEARTDIEVRVSMRFSPIPLLNLAIGEMQKTSHRPAHCGNVMSEQRKSNWQHPNTDYRQREEAQQSSADERDAGRHPHPYRTLPPKAVEIMANPARDVILEAVHFLVKIGNPRHSCLSGMNSIRSDVASRRDRPLFESLKRITGAYHWAYRCRRGRAQRREQRSEMPRR